MRAKVRKVMSRIYKKLIDEERPEPEVMPLRSRAHLQLMPPPPSARMLLPYFKKKTQKSRILAGILLALLATSGTYFYQTKLRNLPAKTEMVKKDDRKGSLQKSSALPKVVKSPEKVIEDAAQVKQAVLLYQRQDFSPAKQIFERLAVVYPESTELANNLAMTYFKLSEISQARKQFARALKLNRADPSTLNNLGSFYLAQREFAQAVLYFKQAIANEPGFLEAHLNLGIAYELSGQPLSSIPEYETYLELAGPNPKLRPVLVKRLERMKAFSPYYVKFSAEELYD